MRHALVPASDTIEITEVVRTVRRGWRAVLVGVTTGLLVAVGVLLFAPRIYQGKASVLVKANSGAGASLMSRLGAVGEVLGSGGGSLGLPKTPLETEIQVLNSRALAGSVVDSLQLQVRVLAPAGLRPSAFVQASTFPGAFAPRQFRFERAAAGRYRAAGGSFQAELVQGQSGPIPVGAITLATGSLPEEFELKIYDREDAIDRLERGLDVGKAGGDVARVTYRGRDSLTAAAVPNVLLEAYLERRKTTDRGTNQKRVEFLTEQVDKTAAELSAAERELRLQQERSGILDAQVMGRVGLEQGAELRKLLIEVQVEEGAINQLLAQSVSSGLSGRQIAGYPAFLKGASLNSLLGQLAQLDAERIRLLERRTEQDPEVIAITQSITAVEGQFLPMARAYASALGKQRIDMSKQLDSVQSVMLTIPAAAEAGGRLQRDVIRLNQIYAAMQAELVQARLAAIDEGGDVRQLDVAVPPRKVWFPRPVTTLAAGLGGGLLVGLVAALVLSWFGRWVRDPAEMERVTGVPAQRLQSGTPLLFGGGQSVTRTLLVVPVEDRARAAGGLVAERLLRTATNRSLSATVLDLSTDALRSANGGSGNGSGASAGIAALISDLEQRHGLVIVQLPGLSSDATVAAMGEGRPVLLVAPSDRVDRARLMSAVETLRRLQIPCAGIVIGDTVSSVV